MAEEDVEETKKVVFSSECLDAYPQPASVVLCHEVRTDTVGGGIDTTHAVFTTYKSKSDGTSFGTSLTGMVVFHRMVTEAKDISTVELTTEEFDLAIAAYLQYKENVRQHPLPHPVEKEMNPVEVVMDSMSTMIRNMGYVPGSAPGLWKHPDEPQKEERKMADVAEALGRHFAGNDGREDGRSNTVALVDPGE